MGNKISIDEKYAAAIGKYAVHYQGGARPPPLSEDAYDLHNSLAASRLAYSRFGEGKGLETVDEYNEKLRSAADSGTAKKRILNSTFADVRPRRYPEEVVNELERSDQSQFVGDYEHYILCQAFREVDGRTEKTLYVAFRGTVDKDDWWRDVDATEAGLLHGKVHRGFLRRAENVNLVFLRNMLVSERVDRLVLTGHSLGGAVASLVTFMLLFDEESASAWTHLFDNPHDAKVMNTGSSESSRLKEPHSVLRCITFGQPLVFDASAARAISEDPRGSARCFLSVVNTNDLVPYVTVLGKAFLSSGWAELSKALVTTLSRASLKFAGVPADGALTKMAGKVLVNIGGSLLPKCQFYPVGRLFGLRVPESGKQAFYEATKLEDCNKLFKIPKRLGVDNIREHAMEQYMLRWAAACACNVNGHDLIELLPRRIEVKDEEMILCRSGPGASCVTLELTNKLSCKLVGEGLDTLAGVCVSYRIPGRSPPIKRFLPVSRLDTDGTSAFCRGDVGDCVQLKDVKVELVDTVEWCSNQRDGAVYVCFIGRPYVKDEVLRTVHENIRVERIRQSRMIGLERPYEVIRLALFRAAIHAQYVQQVSDEEGQTFQQHAETFRKSHGASLHILDELCKCGRLDTLLHNGGSLFSVFNDCRTLVSSDTSVTIGGSRRKDSPPTNGKRATVSCGQTTNSRTSDAAVEDGLSEGDGNTSDTLSADDAGDTVVLADRDCEIFGRALVRLLEEDGNEECIKKLELDNQKAGQLSDLVHLCESKLTVPTGKLKYAEPSLNVWFEKSEFLPTTLISRILQRSRSFINGEDVTASLIGSEDNSDVERFVFDLSVPLAFMLTCLEGKVELRVRDTGVFEGEKKRLQAVLKMGGMALLHVINPAAMPYFVYDYVKSRKQRSFRKIFEQGSRWSYYTSARSLLAGMLIGHLDVYHRFGAMRKAALQLMYLRQAPRSYTALVELAYGASVVSAGIDRGAVKRSYATDEMEYHVWKQLCEDAQVDSSNGTLSFCDFENISESAVVRKNIEQRMAEVDLEPMYRVTKSIALVHALRQEVARTICIGVVGPTEVGKSELIHCLFGYRTSAGSMLNTNRTMFTHCYREEIQSSSDGSPVQFLVYDFPGWDDNKAAQMQTSGATPSSKQMERVQQYYGFAGSTMDVIIFLLDAKRMEQAPYVNMLTQCISSGGLRWRSGGERGRALHHGTQVLVCINKADKAIYEKFIDWRKKAKRAEKQKQNGANHATADGTGTSVDESSRAPPTLDTHQQNFVDDDENGYCSEKCMGEQLESWYLDLKCAGCWDLIQSNVRLTSFSPKDENHISMLKKIKCRFNPRDEKHDRTVAIEDQSQNSDTNSRPSGISIPGHSRASVPGDVWEVVDVYDWIADALTGPVESSGIKLHDKFPSWSRDFVKAFPREDVLRRVVRRSEAH